MVIDAKFATRLCHVRHSNQLVPCAGVSDSGHEQHDPQGNVMYYGFVLRLLNFFLRRQLWMVLGLRLYIVGRLLYAPGCTPSDGVRVDLSLGQRFIVMWRIWARHNVQCPDVT